MIAETSPNGGPIWQLWLFGADGSGRAVALAPTRDRTSGWGRPTGKFIVA